MILEKILQDIRSPRVKKVIADTDTFNEMDDQYALAYAIASEKIDVLSINAAPFHNERSSGFEDGMEKSYLEILRVLEKIGKTGRYPVFKGSRTRISDNTGVSPSDSPAARNIIKTALSLNETLYILATGAITNVVSAVLIEPSIKDRICVIWLGGHCLDHHDLREFNLMQDYIAGQLLLDLDIPLVMLPACDHGTKALEVSYGDLKMIKGNTPSAVFFRETLPGEFKLEVYKDGWRRIIWDIAAPAVLSVPDAFDFSVIPAPVFGDDFKYSFDETRRKIIYMNKLDKETVIKDAFTCISRLT